MSATQSSSTQLPSPKDRAKIISTIKKLVSERHINVSNPNQDYRPWLALVDEKTPRLMELEREAFEAGMRSEEHTSELQSQSNLVCRLLLEKKKKNHAPSRLALK